MHPDMRNRQEFTVIQSSLIKRYIFIDYNTIMIIITHFSTLLGVKGDGPRVICLEQLQIISGFQTTHSGRYLSHKEKTNKINDE